MAVSLIEIYNQKPAEFTLYLDSLLSLTDLKTCKGEHFDNFHFADGLLQAQKDCLISRLMSSKLEVALVA